jgi:hypothetical protein
MYFYIFLSGEYDQQLQQAAIRGKNEHVQKDSHRNQMVMNRLEIYFLRKKKGKIEPASKEKYFFLILVLLLLFGIVVC